MLKVLNKYSDFIKTYDIVKYNVAGSSYELGFIIVFYNMSELHVSDYVFLNGDRKYTFHFQNRFSELIFRYDTAPHYKELATYPYHKHLKDGNVIESNIMYLDEVLQEIVLSL